MYEANQLQLLCFCVRLENWQEIREPYWLGNKGVPMRTLWIYLVVKSPEDFLITQWKWLLRPNVPTAIHGQESRASHSLWGKHPWGLPLPRGFGSHGCAGWEDLQRAVYKLGTQESQWYESAWVRKPESQELCCQKAGKMGVPAQEERKNLPFLHPGPSMDWMMAAHISEDRALLSLLTQMLISQEPLS